RRRRRLYELPGRNELSQSDRPARRANVVVVGTRHLLPLRRRRASCERDRGRLSPGHGAARCRMGRAVLSPDRPGWSRAQLRQAAAVKALVSRYDFLDVTKVVLKLRSFPPPLSRGRTPAGIHDFVSRASEARPGTSRRDLPTWVPAFAGTSGL